MSKAVNSPTARLLQSSRLFSLPRPLPQPAVELSTASGIYKDSDSKTLPYPTHQAIATPASSHFRGDWGLKRPLPRRVTQETSTPHLRIRAQDTIDHITDFESASDHTRTEAKWQQMGIPMVVRHTRNNMTDERTPKSVYDEDVDNTNPLVDGIIATSGNRAGPRLQANASASPGGRWKHDGPWIAGMDEGEFQEYLKYRINNRSEEFRKFLFERMLRKHIIERRSEARIQGRTLNETAIKKLRAEYAAHFDEETKNIRFNHMQTQLSSDVTDAICEFLDLPAVRPTRLDDRRNASAQIINVTLGSPRPITQHPGAGLSHIRTSLIMENHPLYGPQAKRSPVLARVVKPRVSVLNRHQYAKLGIGGVVADDSIPVNFNARGRVNRSSGSLNDSEEDRYLHAESMTHSVDPDLVHGNHIYVHTESAHLDEGGSIRLKNSRGDEEAIAVKRNAVGPIFEARNATIRPPIPNQARPGTAGNANYGASLPDWRRASPLHPGVQTHERVPERTAQQGQASDNTAAGRMQTLLEGYSRPNRQ